MFSTQIKERIQAETGLIASVGVAPNKFLAKLASDQGKPNGFVMVPAPQVALQDEERGLLRSRCGLRCRYGSRGRRRGGRRLAGAASTRGERADEEGR